MGASTGRVWRRLRRHPSGAAGLALVAVLALVALLAPLLASEAPLAARHRDAWVFPAFAGYVDAWLPWPSVRAEVRSLEVGDGWFPFSGHYPGLDGRTWKEAQGTPELSWALWPPIRHDPARFEGGAMKRLPGEDPAHPLGTDDRGRDVLARIVHGTAVAFQVGVGSQVIVVAVGLGLGLAAGTLGGKVDLLLGRLTEIVMCFPTFFLVIAVISFLEPSLINVMAVLGLVGWTRVFRLVRGEVLRVRRLDYVLAARAAGFSTWRVALVHVLPNAVAPVFVAVAFGVASAILAETSLSFLGFGDPSAPSWGELVSQGRAYVGQGLWHLALFPGIAIFTTLLGFNLLGQGLRDALDPRQASDMEA